jgi:hypothetical protein
MSIKQRFGLFFTAAVMATVIAVPVASAARVVPPVGNLHLVSGDANQVKIAWDAPSTSDLGNATIDAYVIRRNGHRLDTLQGFSGIVDTSYTDGSPSLRKATYTVTAVDSEGRRSPPTSLSVPAPQGVLPSPKLPDGEKDGIQSSDFCKAIIPPDIRGSNQPTALEKYGCGKGMNAMNESDPSKINVLFVHTSVPRPIHDGIQAIMQFLESAGQEFFLLLSAMTIWVMQESTYLGIANLFAGIIQAFHGDPSFDLIFSLTLMVGLAVLARRLWREEHREGYTSIGVIVAAMTAITLLASSPYHWMRNIVTWPLQGYTAINNSLGGFTAGRDVTREYNLTVRPTFSGDKTNAATRKQQELDYLMFQYIPHCAANFQDYQWSMTTYVPGERITFCERFVQIWDRNNDHLQEGFKKDVEKANNGNADFFQGKDQMTQAFYIGLAKVALGFHGLMEFFRNLSVFGSEIILLGIYLLGLLIMMYVVTGTEGSRWTLQQWWLTMIQALKVPASMLGFCLIQLALESHILTPQDTMGFLFAEFLVIALDLVLLIAMVVVLRTIHHSYKDKMEARKSFRDLLAGNRGMGMGKLATAAALGTGGASLAMAGAGAAARGANNFRKWLLDSDDDQEVPSDRDGRNSDFGVPQPLMLEAGPANGYGNQSTNGNQPPNNGGGGAYFDEEWIPDAEVVEPLQIEQETGRNGHGTTTADPTHNPHQTEVVTDAEVVDDDEDDRGRYRDERVRDFDYPERLFETDDLERQRDLQEPERFDREDFER